MKRYLLIVVLLFAASVLKAQTPDTTARHNKKDSLNLKHDAATERRIFTPEVKPKKKEPVYHPDSTHSPRKAVMRSLYFPGLGQIYNRHGLWWRLPAIYGGLATLAYNIYTNGKDYNIFLKESQWREHGRPPELDANGNIIGSGEPVPVYNGSVITNISDQTIYNYKDNLRRNRDLSIFGFVAVWGINIVDAYVEAKFMHSYTMDDNLSVKISPSFINPSVYASNFNSTFTPALKITFFLK